MQAEDFRQETYMRGYCCSSDGRKYEAEAGQELENGKKLNSGNS
jgi:hypothetical protein